MYEKERCNPADNTEVNDPQGLTKDALRERIRRRGKKTTKLENIKPIVYSIIKRQLSRRDNISARAGS